MLAEPFANLGQGDHRRLLRLAPLPVQAPCAVLLRFLIATADGGLALLCLVVAPLLSRPSEQFVQVGAVAVEEERRVHHVVVVVTLAVHHLPLLQCLLHAGPRLVHRHRVRASRILLAGLAAFLVAREVGRQDLLVGDDKRLRLPIHIYLRVVSQSTQPRIVATLRVVLMTH